MGVGVSLEAEDAVCRFKSGGLLEWAKGATQARAQLVEQEPLTWEAAWSQSDAARQGRALDLAGLEWVGKSPERDLTEQESSAVAAGLRAINEVYLTASFLPCNGTLAKAFSDLMRKQLTTAPDEQAWCASMHALHDSLYSYTASFANDASNETLFRYAVPEADRAALPQHPAASPDSPAHSTGRQSPGGSSSAPPEQSAGDGASPGPPEETPTLLASLCALEIAAHKDVVFLRCPRQRDAAVQAIAAYVKTVGCHFKRIPHGTGFGFTAVEVPLCFEMQHATHSYLCLGVPKERLVPLDPPADSIPGRSFGAFVCGESFPSCPAGRAVEAAVGCETGATYVLPASDAVHHSIASEGAALPLNAALALCTCCAVFEGADTSQKEALLGSNLDGAVDAVRSCVAAVAPGEAALHAALGVMFEATGCAAFKTLGYSESTRCAVRKLLYIEAMAVAASDVWLTRCSGAANPTTESHLALWSEILKSRDKAFWHGSVGPAASRLFCTELGRFKLTNELIKGIKRRFCALTGAVTQGGVATQLVAVTRGSAPAAVSSSLLRLLCAHPDRLADVFTRHSREPPAPYTPVSVGLVQAAGLQAAIAAREAKQQGALPLLVPTAALCYFEGGAARLSTLLDGVKAELGATDATGAAAFANEAARVLIDSRARAFVVNTALDAGKPEGALALYTEMYGADIEAVVASLQTPPPSCVTAEQAGRIAAIRREGLDLCGCLLSDAGGSLMNAKRYTESEECLRVATRLLGATESKEAVLTKSNLGVCLYQQGAPRRAEAIDVYREVLKEAEQLEDSDDSRRVSAMNNLASLLYYENSPKLWAESETLYTQALQLSGQDVPPDDTLALGSASSKPMGTSDADRMRRSMQVVKMKRATWASIRIQCMFRRHRARIQLRNYQGYRHSVAVRPADGADGSTLPPGVCGTYVLLPTSQWTGAFGEWVQATPDAAHILLAKRAEGRYIIAPLSAGCSAALADAVAQSQPEGTLPFPKAPEQAAGWQAAGCALQLRPAKDALCLEEEAARDALFAACASDAMCVPLLLLQHDEEAHRTTSLCEPHARQQLASVEGGEWQQLLATVDTTLRGAAALSEQLDEVQASEATQRAAVEADETTASSAFPLALQAEECAVSALRDMRSTEHGEALALLQLRSDAQRSLEELEEAAGWTHIESSHLAVADFGRAAEALCSGEAAARLLLETAEEPCGLASLLRASAESEELVGRCGIAHAEGQDFTTCIEADCAAGVIAADECAERAGFARRFGEASQAGAGQALEGDESEQRAAVAEEECAAWSGVLQAQHGDAEGLAALQGHEECEAEARQAVAAEECAERGVLHAGCAEGLQDATAAESAAEGCLQAAECEEAEARQAIAAEECAERDALHAGCAEGLQSLEGCQAAEREEAEARQAITAEECADSSALHAVEAAGREEDEARQAVAAEECAERGVLHAGCAEGLQDATAAESAAEGCLQAAEHEEDEARQAIAAEECADSSALRAAEAAGAEGVAQQLAAAAAAAESAEGDMARHASACDELCAAEALQRTALCDESAAALLDTIALPALLDSEAALRAAITREETDALQQQQQTHAAAEAAAATTCQAADALRLLEEEEQEVRGATALEELLAQAPLLELHESAARAASEEEAGAASGQLLRAVAGDTHAAAVVDAAAQESAARAALAHDEALQALCLAEDESHGYMLLEEGGLRLQLSSGLAALLSAAECFAAEAAGRADAALAAQCEWHGLQEGCGRGCVGAEEAAAFVALRRHASAERPIDPELRKALQELEGEEEGERHRVGGVERDTLLQLIDFENAKAKKKFSIRMLKLEDSERIRRFEILAHEQEYGALCVYATLELEQQELRCRGDISTTQQADHLSDVDAEYHNNMVPLVRAEMLRSIQNTFDSVEALQTRLRSDIVMEEDTFWRQGLSTFRHAQKRMLLEAEEQDSSRQFRAREAVLLFNIESFEVVSSLQEEEKQLRVAMRCDMERETLLTTSRETARREKEREPRRSVRNAAIFNHELETLLRREEEDRAEIKGESYGQFFDVRSLFSEQHPRPESVARARKARHIAHSHAKANPTSRMSAGERLVSAEETFRHTIHSSERLAFNKLMWTAEQNHTRVVINLVKLGRDYEYFGQLIPKKPDNVPPAYSRPM